ncbi:MAG: zinc-binding dehydrogenase [Spirochaetia bacterium]|nr:zinc-binding dehydrogenase [Spirochaetia bacterium]
MKTKAVRLHGKQKLSVDEFELPPIGRDEILAKVITDSVCMSTYKAALLGADHKRVPADIAENPIIIGHEFAGEVIEVGEAWKDRYHPGDKFSVQPNINHKGLGYAPGYSFPCFGGDATYIIIPNEVMENGFYLEYSGDAFYKASLAEPMSCIIAAFHATYHAQKETYELSMGAVPGGRMAILAGAGPMGLGAIDYAMHQERKPSVLVVTDIDSERLERAEALLTVEEAARNGIELIYLNTAESDDPVKQLMAFSDGTGYDDVFVFAPVAAVVEMGDAILSDNGCLNFFAGPTDSSFSASFNFYKVHYARTHIAGTSGGYTSDMKEALEMMGKGLINPSVMVTHIGGLESAVETTLNLPNIPGGKKLIYPHIDMELTAIADFEAKGADDRLFRTLAEIVRNHGGLWSSEAEEVLLSWYGI